MSDAPPGFAPVAESGPPAGFSPVKEQPKARKAHGAAVTDTMGRILGDPQTGFERVAQIALTAPLIGGAGALAAKVGAPAVVGEMAAAGGIGAAQGAQRGEGLKDSAWSGLLDSAVAGLTRGVVKGVSKIPKVGPEALGAGARAFEWATKAPEKALDAIRKRLPTGKWINAPALDTATLTVDEAVKKLSKLTGADYQQARAELASEFSRLDMQKLTGPKPLAGGVFKQRTSPERFEPGALSKVAEGTRKAITSEPGMALAEATAISPYQGVPMGAIGASVAPERFMDLARHLMR